MECHTPPVKVYRLYASVSATGNNSAQVIIPSAARILAVQWALDFDSITDNGACAVEISRASTTEMAVNASQQAVAEVRWFSNFLTSGLAVGNINMFSPVDISVFQGQIIYLHHIITGTVVCRGGALVWTS